MLRSIALAAALLAIGGAAHAQTTLDQLRSQASQLLGRLEVNLTLKETLEAQGSQLEVRNNNLTRQRETTNAEVQQSNAYCQGQFEEAELQRRTAQCSTWQAGLNGRQRDIDNEYANLERLYGDLQRRDEARVQEAQRLIEGFTGSARQWAGGCVQIPAGGRPAACAPLPPAGPRTIELLNWAQAMFDQLETQCANLNAERMVECERQAWDGSIYRPNRPDVPVPH